VPLRIVTLIENIPTELRKYLLQDTVHTLPHVEISDSVNTFTLPKELVPPGSNKMGRMICFNYIRIW